MSDKVFAFVIGERSDEVSDVVPSVFHVAFLCHAHPVFDFGESLRMGRYNLTRSAAADFENIFEYGIDTFVLEQALKYQNGLKQSFETLADRPEQYPSVAHIRIGYPGQHDAIVEKETWDAVQTMLDDQAPARTSPTNIKQQFLLTGLAFDEQGDRLSPSYARKNGRRYRYYISNRLMQGTDKSKGWRIPAEQLEQAVLQELSRFLEDGVQVANAIYGPDAAPGKVQASVRIAAKLSKEIRESPSTDILVQARQLIERVDFDGEQLRIQVFLAGLSECIGATDATGGGPVVLETPITFRRRGVESKIILSGASKAALPDSGLIDLVSNTYQWAQKIFRREVRTVREISRKATVDEGDVSRFLPFAFLAPDIVEAIIKGRQPNGLTSEKLKCLRNLPKSWKEQRKLLGFTS